MTHEPDDSEIDVISRDEMAAGAQKALRMLFKRLDKEAETMPLGCYRARRLRVLEPFSIRLDDGRRRFAPGVPIMDPDWVRLTGLS